MRKKNILLVSNGFYPEISPRSYRATELAKEFYRQGHKVTVLSKYRDHNYSSFLKDYPITFNMWGKPVLPKIPASRIRVLSVLLRAIKRMMALLFEYPRIEEIFKVRKILKNYRGFDLIISFAVPYTVHWGTAKAWSNKQQVAKVWIADCGDPYMFARLDTFKKPFYFKYLEVLFCEKCNYITVPFPEMKVQFYNQFFTKIRVIPQGVNMEEIKLYKGVKSDSFPVFIFAGSIMPGKRDLNLFMDYLTKLDRDFKFIVYSNKPELFTKYKLLLGEKLLVLPYVDRLTLIYEMSKVDFLINVDSILDTGDNVEAIPSKLIDYALANRPILNLNTANLDKDLVNKFLNRDYSGRRIIDKSQYNIKTVSKSFLELAD